jgi:hypothetical protein
LWGEPCDKGVNRGHEIARERELKQPILRSLSAPLDRFSAHQQKNNTRDEIR